MHDESSSLANYLSQQLSSSQYKLCKAEARLKVFQMLQSNIAANISIEKEIELNRGVHEDMEDEWEDAEEGCSLDDLIREIVTLKNCAAFRGTEESFLGQALGTAPCDS